jgi:hypothetical protein
MILRRIRAVVQTAKAGVDSATGTQRSQQNQFAYGRTTGTAQESKLALLVGFAMLGLGVFAAHRSPATGYEVSVYWATPRLYWVGAGGALLVAMTTLLYDHESRFAPLSMLLGTASVASFLALPVIRNYYFHGYADPMTHLGGIRALAAGFESFVEPIYPGTYVVTAFLSSFGGLSVNRSMLYVMFVFGLVFFAFVPLTVRAIVPDRRAFLIGLFSAFLLLPVNNVSLFYRFHPFSLTTLYFPLVAYLFVAHVTHALDDHALPRTVNASTVALPLATTGLLLFHPQTAVDVLIIFAMVIAVQAVARLVAPDHPLARQRAIYGNFAFLAVLFLLWVSMHQGGTGRTIDALTDGLFGWISGEAETAGVVQSRTSSSESIGVSTYTLFVKFFLVSAVYSLLASGVIVAKFLGRLGPDPFSLSDARTEVITLLAFGGIGLLPFIFVHSFGRAADYLFRHIGFWMAIVTILGAVALYYLLTGLSARLGGVAGTLKPAFGVLATVVIVLSLLSVYSSPFLYLPGQHVSEQEMDGMETAFEMQPEDRSVWFGGVRQNANRYESAMFAAPNVSWTKSPTARISKPVDDENLTRLRWHYENHPEKIVKRDQYIMVSEQDYKTEVVAYDGLRYSRRNISSVADQTDVYNIYSNGEAQLYYIDTRGTPVVNGTVSDPVPGE